MMRRPSSHIKNEIQELERIADFNTGLWNYPFREKTRPAENAHNLQDVLVLQQDLLVDLLAKVASGLGPKPLQVTRPARLDRQTNPIS